MPGVGRIIRVVQRHRLRSDVSKFDELVERIVVRADHRRRLVHDFIDNNRADRRTGVVRAERVRGLRDKMFLADAGDVAAERNAVLRGIELEAVEVAREIGRRVSGEQPDLVAQ